MDCREDTFRAHSCNLQSNVDNSQPVAIIQGPQRQGLRVSMTDQPLSEIYRGNVPRGAKYKFSRSTHMYLPTST